MKFTPNIDRFQKRYDTATKIHVSFDEPEENHNGKKRAAQDSNNDNSRKKNKVDNKNNKDKGNKNKKAAKKELTEEEILAKVAAIRLKKKLKRKNKANVNGQLITRAAFQFNPKSLTQAIPTTQIREFILYALSETCNLPWCTIINKSQVERLVVIYAPGLNCSYFGLPQESNLPFVDLQDLPKEAWIGKSSMPFLTKQSRYMLVHMISGEKEKLSSPVADMLQCSISNSKKEKLIDENQKKIQAFKDNMREYYMLTLDEMKKAGFPIPTCLDPTAALPDGWKETRPPVDGVMKPVKRIIAVDCEMVMTEKGSALARITLIDEDGSILLDELVKPDAPITDYLTQYSGITPEAMGATTCSLRRAQKHVRKIVDHNVILVGHGLENDLKAMQLAHPYCVDTSRLYDHMRGPPYKPSLKHLARTYLQRNIQGHNQSLMGHDSAEDARATLDLFKLKLANKPRFGRFKKVELVFDRLSANRPPRSSAILESARSATRLFGDTLSGDYHRTDTDEELVELTLEKIKEKNFLFTRYITADDTLTRQQQQDSGAPTVLPSAASDAQRATQLQTLDSYIRRVYHGLPENSFLVVVGGVCNIPQYKA
ncbi:hypothetical protein BCV72DRAFT_313644 [Rhizopus microsporus var. microsporus]|nr:hypothetical protein BCV72DRAFT_313644 [Rhizopus microsporus var. microsporus]